MKSILKSLLFLVFMSICLESYGQFGMGNMGRDPYSGRRQSLAPQEPMRQDKPENLTAEQLVDAQMPSLTETLGLSVFEEAVVRTILVNSVQKRIQLQLLKLDPEKTKESAERIQKEQEEALKNGLPIDKYEAFVALQEDGFKKPKKKKKQKKKKS
ncbi:MAG: hypothetical protein ACI9KR_001160 [Arcticibacterium sp.]|jgi:hypothetical protein|tara:strand:- start:228 stop:695 length:468 start_codon:yes stop_codon:yes gene_type:complete